MMPQVVFVFGAKFAHYAKRISHQKVEIHPVFSDGAGRAVIWMEQNGFYPIARKEHHAFVFR
ncbi:hypothetical protein LJC59_01800 [Desulfovibrio sp. OttesenSCG-928-A18]|nr:hypothetical protein [Desulfovibrio sp. OttesenSCG-928-A18]